MLRFEILNDHAQTEELIGRVNDELRRASFGNQSEMFRVTMALKEAVSNAIDHGNLELDSTLRDVHDPGYRELGDHRSQQQPYCDRRVYITFALTPESLTLTVRDEGPGFDPGEIPDPTEIRHRHNAHGRGLMLIHSYMDRVTHDATGNTITMVRHRP
jgi:anti-sigma regulatory factor (Ser/Thr protein kinase)